MADLGHLVVRIEQIEAQLRRTRYVAFSALAILLSYIILANVAERKSMRLNMLTAEIIRLQSSGGQAYLAFHDSQGHLTMWLQPGDGGNPVLSMFDERGKNRLQISVDKQGPVCTLTDQEEKTLVRISVKNNTPSIKVRDREVVTTTEKN